ncbi:MAG TPA: DUF1579 family protein [Fimbriimonadaceae bacterium]|jgi:hypothetical protein
MLKLNFKLIAIAAAVCSCAAANAQAPIQIFTQILGTWVGTVKFNTAHSALQTPADASVKVTTAVKGHYIEFERVLFLPGGADESLSLLTFDPVGRQYEMWSYNEHTPGARMLSGNFDDKHQYLTLTSPGILESGSTVAYKEIFHIESPEKFTLEYDIRLNDKWQEDFTITFTRKVEVKK